MKEKEMEQVIEEQVEEQREKLEALREEVERRMDKIEELLAVGNYREALYEISRLKPFVRLLKEEMKRGGNRYFALINEFQEAKESLKRGQISDLESSLNKIEKLLLS